MNKINIEGMQSAENGVIYDFIEKTGEVSKKVLVVQNGKRSEDNLVSVLMLGTKKGMSDTIPVKLDGTTYYVHCGMITYCKRIALGRRCGRVSNDTLDRIKNNIAYQLGIGDGNNYKELYENLLEKVANR